jgi:N6-adenosine-specific RNA methylase IME4
MPSTHSTVAETTVTVPLWRAAAAAAAAAAADHDICNLPIPQLQAPGGFLFVWVINSKYSFTLDLFDKWGYT